MKKVYYLSTCSTCKRIISELDLAGFEFQDIKVNPVTEAQLMDIHALSQSFEDLFSKRAIKYKTMGLKEKSLGEKDFKKLLIEEYTFLKRPVIRVYDKIFIGNSKKTIEAIKTYLANESDF